jgi:hypothetical protein
MDDCDRVLAWCRAERQKMEDQRNGSEAGKFQLHDRSIERIDKAVADLDRLLGQLERRLEREQWRWIR